MDFFLWGHLMGHVYAVPPRSIKDLMEKLQAAVTTVNANACSGEFHMAGILPLP
jgi:hypothetical protein